MTELNDADLPPLLETLPAGRLHPAVEVVTDKEAQAYADACVAHALAGAIKDYLAKREVVMRQRVMKGRQDWLECSEKMYHTLKKDPRYEVRSLIVKE